MSDPFHKLLSQHVGASFAKQLAFADRLPKGNWHIDIKGGSLSFDDGSKFPIQIMGTESDGNSSWLWAWANEASNLPPQLLQSCIKLREQGNQESIPELTDPTFSLDVANGHTLSLAASGIIGKCCYYCAPYSGGALYALIFDIRPEVFQPIAPERMLTVIQEVISQFDVDHRLMVESLFRSQDYTLEATANAMKGLRDGSTIQISFNDQGLIDNITANIEPTKSEKKPWWKFWS